jgi:hypothetical protein
MYECRCDERLQTKGEESTCLSYTGFLVELEHLKIKTTLTDEMFGECDGGVCVLEVWVFIIRVERELKRVYRNGCRYNERLYKEVIGVPSIFMFIIMNR